MGRDLPLRQFAIELGAPCFRNTAAPTSECTSRNIGRIKNVPSCSITAPAVAGKPMQLAIRFNEIRRLQPGILDGGAELF